jgi:alpha-soluble NSF attachment protein
MADKVGVSIGQRSNDEGGSVMNKFATLADRAKMGLFDPNLVQGEQFVQRAEKALRQSTLFSSFPKLEDCMYYYAKAAECFRRSKLWEEAGDCYHRVAENQKNSGNKHACAMAYVDCAEMYVRLHPKECLVHYHAAISMFAEIGRFLQAAKYQEVVAHIEEEDNEELKAVTSYQQAADYYIADGEHTLADRCLEKVATICAYHEQYDRASETMEALGMRCLQFNLRRFNAKTFFFWSGLMQYCKKDYKAAQRIRRRHKGLDYTYANMAECRFLEDIGQNMRDGDFDAFMDHCYNFNNVNPLNVWELTMLERCKKIISHKQFERIAKEKKAKQDWIEANKKKKK